jgi:hypothetical protein
LTGPARCYEGTRSVDWNNNGVFDPPGAPLWDQDGGTLFPNIASPAQHGWNLGQICTFEKYGEFLIGEPASGAWTISARALLPDDTMEPAVSTPVPFGICRNPMTETDLLIRDALRLADARCYDESDQVIVDATGPECETAAGVEYIEVSLPDPRPDVTADFSADAAPGTRVRFSVPIDTYRALADNRYAVPITDSNNFRTLKLPNLRWSRVREILYESTTTLMGSDGGTYPSVARSDTIGGDDPTASHTSGWIGSLAYPEGR